MKTVLELGIRSPSPRSVRDARVLAVILVLAQVALVAVAVVSAVRAVYPAERATGRSLVCMLEGPPGTLPVAALNDNRPQDVPLAGASCVLADPADEAVLIGDVVPAPRSVGVVSADGVRPTVPGCTTRDRPDAWALGTRGETMVAELHFDCVRSLPLPVRLSEALFVHLVPAALVIAGAQLLGRLLSPLRRREAVDFLRPGATTLHRLRTLALALAAVAVVGAFVERHVAVAITGDGALPLFRVVAAFIAATAFSVLATIWDQAADLQAEQEGVV